MQRTDYYAYIYNDDNIEAVYTTEILIHEHSVYLTRGLSPA
jgi:hypothetical protein